MRINRIDLLAFGPFTDVSLDFGADLKGLHLIYGDNEAGKTSSLRAIFSLLFRIPARSTDDFVHDYKAMRLGGELQNAGGQTIAFLRRKGTKNDLLNPADNSALPQNVLDAFLGGMDLATFERIWGIDHHKLIDGGRELKALKGLAGESLFAAALGVGGLSDALAALESDAQKLFLPGRRSKTEIRVATDAHADASKRKREAGVSIGTWTKLQKELKSTQTRHQEVRENADRLRSESNRVSRILGALADIGERRVVQGDLADRESVVVLPSEYSVDARRSAQDSLDNASAQRRDEIAELEGDDGLVARCANLQVDKTVLEEERAIGQVQEEAGAYRKTCADLPNREVEKRFLLEEAKRVLAEIDSSLSWEEAERLRLTKAAEAEIGRLGQRHGSLSQNLTGFQEQMTELTSEIENAQKGLGALAPAIDTSALQRAVKGAQPQDGLHQSASAKEVESSALAEQANDGISRLGLWQGTLEEALRLTLPLRATVDDYAEKFRAIDDEVAGLEKETRKQSEDLARIQGEMEAEQRRHQVPTRDELREQRERRDTGWQLVRGAWLDAVSADDAVAQFSGERGLPEAYENAIELADHTADQLVDDSEKSAALEQQRHQCQVCEAALTDLEAQRQQVPPRRDALSGDWQKLWMPQGIEKPLSPKEMVEWLDRFAAVRALSEKHFAARDEVAAKQHAQLEHRGRLVDCLSDLEPEEDFADSPFDKVLDHCEELLQRDVKIEQERRSLGEAVASKQIKLDLLEGRKQSAESELAGWKQKWSTALSDLGSGADLSVSQADDRVRIIREFFSKRDAIEELAAKRIVPMQGDKARFETEVARLVEHCATDLAGQDPAVSASTLATRLREAQKAFQDRASLQEQIETRQKQVKKLERKEAEAQVRLQKLCQLAGVAEPGVLIEREETSRSKQELIALLKEIDSRLLTVGDGMSVENLIEETSDKSSDDLQVKLENLKDQIGTAESERDDLAGEVRALQEQLDAVDAGEEGTAADEEALGCIAQISQHAEQYLRLRLASSLLRRRIEKHRAENQDPMIARASEIFSLLTCDSFEGLTLDYNDKEEPTIVGVQTGKSESLQVEHFSTGAADQLYLSLRLAYLENRLRTGEPMPLILDDILVDFDDDRAVAALKVLAELAQETQVILFSHHKHLRELARKTIGKEGLVEHDLGSL